MTYLGEVQNGVVVLHGSPRLEEGTQVRVEVQLPSTTPRIGSAEAILKHAGGWAESADEMQDALEYLRQSKQDQLRAQLSEPDKHL